MKLIYDIYHHLLLLFTLSSMSIYFRSVFLGTGKKSGLLGTIFQKVKETFLKPYEDNDVQSMQVLYDLLMGTSLCTMVDVASSNDETIGTLNLPGTPYFSEVGKCIIGTLRIEINLEERVVKTVEFITDGNHGLKITNQEFE